MADPTPITCPNCAGCGLSLDLAEPHITITRQVERDQQGHVVILAVQDVEHRHQQCATGDAADAARARAQLAAVMRNRHEDSGIAGRLRHLVQHDGRRRIPAEELRALLEGTTRA